MSTAISVFYFTRKIDPIVQPHNFTYTTINFYFIWANQPFFTVKKRALI